jgi:hypothetical protein
MPTASALAASLGLDGAARLALQLAVAAPAVAAAGWIWLRCRDAELRAVALLCACLLCSPYLLDYDLSWLGLAVAWYVRLGMREGWLPREREMLLAAWLLPLLLVPLYALLHVQAGMLGILAVLFLTLRCMRPGVQSTSL